MLRFRFALPLLLAASLGAACEDPTENKPRAAVGAATPAPAPSALPAAGAPRAAAETLRFDGTNSKIAFVGSKVTGKHDGGFKTFQGEIKLDPTRTEASSLTLDIDVTSTFTDTDKLTLHLQSPDFFEVAKYPKATFVSTKIEPSTDKGATHVITGNLSLHGVEKSVSFPATVNVTPAAVTATSEFSLNRKDFGINYPGQRDDLIRDNVLVKLDINAPRAR